MKRNARALAAIILSGGMIGVTASPVLANGDDPISALSTGMAAPSLSVGTDEVKKGTVQYSNSTGTSDAFNVGTLSSISASVSASSTPDYNVNSVAKFGVGASTINQVIGTAGASSSTSSSQSSLTDSSIDSIAESQSSSDFQKIDASNGGGYWWWNRRKNKRQRITDSEFDSTKSSYTASLKTDIQNSLAESSATSGTISGVFKKTDGAADGSSSNEVTVQGIGADNKITAADGAAFDTSIIKVGLTQEQLADPSLIPNTGAGTASGSAAGSVNTTASANANSSQFVSSFAQAY
jgi:hypothetical protein